MRSPVSAWRRGRVALLAGVTLLVACGATTPPPPSATPRPSTPPCDEADPNAWGLYASVSDPSGAPIEGAVVELESGSFFGNARTNADGEFWARCVWGTFEVSVAHLDYAGALRTVVVDPGERPEIAFELEPIEP
jgi:hypothetical protein